MLNVLWLQTTEAPFSFQFIVKSNTNEGSYRTSTFSVVFFNGDSNPSRVVEHQCTSELRLRLLRVRPPFIMVSCSFCIFRAVMNHPKRVLVHVINAQLNIVFHNRSSWIRTSSFNIIARGFNSSIQ